MKSLYEPDLPFDRTPLSYREISKIIHKNEIKCLYLPIRSCKRNSFKKMSITEIGSLLYYRLFLD